MEDALITVIVPVYNVEKYLKKCVDSIIGQTYRNLEIILVDDGSRDTSGSICDEYAKQDNRIIVIHKENGGMSDARNAALDIAKGDCITCVDSDDYLEPDYIQYLYTLLVKNEADISICAFKKVYNGSEKLDNLQDTVKNYNDKEALEELLYQKRITPGPWCKLYKSKLFDNIRYPVGLYYEDLAVIYRLILCCKKITIGRQQKYYYRQRHNSIMNEEFNVKKMHRIQVVNEMKQYIDTRYPDLKMATSTRCFIAGIQVYREIPKDRKYTKYLEEAWQQIAKYRSETVFNRNAKASTRIMALSTYLGKQILAVLGRCYTAVFVRRNKNGKLVS